MKSQNPHTPGRRSVTDKLVCSWVRQGSGAQGGCPLTTRPPTQANTLPAEVSLRITTESPTSPRDAVLQLILTSGLPVESGKQIQHFPFREICITGKRFNAYKPWNRWRRCTNTPCNIGELLLLDCELQLELLRLSSCSKSPIV